MVFLKKLIRIYGYFIKELPLVEIKTKILEANANPFQFSLIQKIGGVVIRYFQILFKFMENFQCVFMSKLD